MPLNKEAMKNYQRVYQKARRTRIRGGEPISTLREAAKAIGDLNRRVDRMEEILLNAVGVENRDNADGAS